MTKEFLCNDRESLYLKVTKRCALQLTRGVEKQGRASMVVPGGTTPAPVFEKLSHMSLLWHNILVAPSDERWIETTHEQSNQWLIQQKLLVNNAREARLMPLKNEAKTPAEGEAQSELSISELPQPFDVTLLGMGKDGHFASLFPGAQQIGEAMDPAQTKKCIGINAQGCPVAGEYTQRMSLTLPALLHSQLIILLITGKEKLEVLRGAGGEKDVLKQPISALLNQRQTPVEVYWAE
ncbi:6-phosphogluconolactonase [Aliikangiella coralliicola]|uniref:6-phosphogluconolactonase n=1 Tax=Aliikangiella coralliicola TaxID=2592383 RepID=A0A545UJP8_9GAMM|nr:6-phosphogluconolactonase [Aliikangiella coralliicola]TQV89690.1 6-phosphogluconolactonase [Aliikangiella coralliicola]